MASIIIPSEGMLSIPCINSSDVTTPVRHVLDPMDSSSNWGPASVAIDRTAHK